MEPTDPEPQRPSQTPKRGKPAHLRSPLLGGGGDEEEDVDYHEPRSVKPIKAKEQTARPKKAGGLRSPLLGGADEDESDYEEDFPMRDREDRSPFPHRSHASAPNEQSHANPPRPKTGKGHLRSPLLGGEDDFEDDMPVPQDQSSPQRGKQRLHSPIFDRASSSSSSGFSDYYDDEEPEEITDPNVLRSPLLAAKARVPDKPAGRPAQQGDAGSYYDDVAQSQPLPGNQPPTAPPQNRYAAAQPGYQQGGPSGQGHSGPAYPSAPSGQQGNPYPGAGAAQPGAPSQYPNSQPGQPGAPSSYSAPGQFGQSTQPLASSYPGNAGYPGNKPESVDPYSKGQALFPTQTGFGAAPGQPNAPQQFAPNASAGSDIPNALEYNFGTGQSQVPAANNPPPLGIPGQPPPIGVGSTIGGAAPTVPLNALPVSQAGLVAPPHELAPANENALVSSKTLEPPKQPDDPLPSKSPKSRFSADKFAADKIESGFGSDTIVESAVDNKIETKSKMRKLPGALEENSKKYEAAPEDHHYSSVPSPPQPNMVLFVPASIAVIGKLWYFGAFASQIMPQTAWLASEVGQIVLFAAIAFYAATKGTK